MMNMNLVASYIANLQESSMFDLCSINTYSETYDSFSDIIKSWTSGSTSASSICGVSLSGGNKNYKEEEIQIKSDVTIRLPLHTIVSEQDTITVTRQNNSTISQTYTIQNIGTGHGELIVKCQKLMV